MFIVLFNLKLFYIFMKIMEMSSNSTWKDKHIHIPMHLLEAK